MASGAGSIMNLGYGFVVSIQTAEAEKQLMKLLAERIENYPVVCKIKTPQSNYRRIESEDPTQSYSELITTKPMEYLISSLDNIFLKFDNASRIKEVPLGLSVRSANANDVWRIRHGFRYCYNKPFLDAVFGDSL